MKRMRFLEAKVTCIVAIIIFTISGLYDLYADKIPAADYNQTDGSNIRWNQVFEGNIPANYGLCLESYSTTNGVQLDNSHLMYLIPVGQDKFMGIEVIEGDYSDLFDQQYEALLKAQEDPKTTIPAVHFRGIAKPLRGEKLETTKATLKQAGLSDKEIEDNLIPYYIFYRDFGMWKILLGLDLLAFILLIIFFRVGRRTKIVPEASSTMYRYANPYRAQEEEQNHEHK